MTNRIAWLKSEEVKTDFKLDELSKLSKRVETKKGTGKAKKDVALQKQGHHSPVVKKLIRGKESFKRAKARTEAIATKINTDENKNAFITSVEEKGKVDSKRDAVVDGIKSCTVERSNENKGSLHDQNIVNKSKSAYSKHSQASTYSALDFLSERWEGNRQPLQENMQSTREKILSATLQGPKETPSGTNISEDSKKMKEFFYYIEYGAGAWKL